MPASRKTRQLDSPDFPHCARPAPEYSPWRLPPALPDLSDRGFIPFRPSLMQLACLLACLLAQHCVGKALRETRRSRRGEPETKPLIFQASNNHSARADDELVRRATWNRIALAL